MTAKRAKDKTAFHGSARAASIWSGMPSMTPRTKAGTMSSKLRLT